MSEKEMGQKIFELRKQLGLTLEDVAKAVGVGKSTVRKWETGIIANMRRDKIASLAKVLHTSPAYLMGWEELDQSIDLEKLTQAVSDSKIIMDSIIKEYGESTWDALNLYIQLDSNDQGEIRGEMKQMLKADKYSIQDGLRNA